MTYKKFTLVSGFTQAENNCPDIRNDYPAYKKWADANQKSTVRPGTWKEESVIALAKKMCLVGTVNVEYFTTDRSGKGRGGIDRRTTFKL